MTDNFAVTVYSLCLAVTLSIAGIITFNVDTPQASAAFFIAAGCAALAGVLAAFVLYWANAARAKARASYVEQYGENPWGERP